MQYITKIALNQFASHASGMKKGIYLDCAAAHPVRPRALRAFLRAISAYGNPGAPHEHGRRALAVLEEARSAIARELGAKSDAVIFTSGATESNALALEGYIQALIARGKRPEEIHVLYLETQHSSVVRVIKKISALGVNTEPIPRKDFEVDLQALKERIVPTTALISMDAVCGETGTLFDTRAVRHLLDEARKGSENKIIFHVDATQAPLTERMDRTRLGADLISFDAQKIGGVRGIGALIAPRHIPLSAIVEGGGQERGLRSGTPSPALARAFALALTEASGERESFTKRALLMRASLIEAIHSIPNTVVNSGTNVSPHILNVSFLGRDTDYLAALLDERGISVSTRSACETDAEGSRVVLAYMSDALRATSTLRISMHAHTTKKEIRKFIRALTACVAFLDTPS
jgi:cysteine desulfurase